MKTTRLLLAIALILTASVSAFGQAWSNYTDLTTEVPNAANYVGTTAADALRVDFVTVGSTMPYYVAPDSRIQTLIGPSPAPFKNSIFQWNVLSTVTSPSAGTTASADGEDVVDPAAFASLTELDNVGAAWGAGLKYYAENYVGITWPATGTKYVVAAEQFVTNSGAAACNVTDAQYTAKTVYVLPTPKSGFDATINTWSICQPAADYDFYVPINLYGLGNFQVDYTVDYYASALTGGVAATTTTTDYNVLLDPLTNITDDATDTYAASSTFYTTLVAANTMAGTPGSANSGIYLQIPSANAWGRYVVTITDITDRISRKSLTAVAGGAFVGDATTFTVYVMPIPANPTIQHLRNDL